MSKELFANEPKMITIPEFTNEMLIKEYIFWQTKKDSLMYKIYQKTFLTEFEKRNMDIPKTLLPGEEVVFVNSYGVCFGKDKVKELREITYGTIGVITENTDTPWYASDISHFREPEQNTREIVYCYITGKKRMLSKCKKCQKEHYIYNSRNFRDGKMTYKEIL